MAPPHREDVLSAHKEDESPRPIAAGAEEDDPDLVFDDDGHAWWVSTQ